MQHYVIENASEDINERNVVGAVNMDYVIAVASQYDINLIINKKH